jgi:hypothetical protein
MGNQPLKLKYPSLFNIVRRKEDTVATILASLVCDCVVDVDRGPLSMATTNLPALRSPV